MELYFLFSPYAGFIFIPFLYTRTFTWERKVAATAAATTTER